MECLYIKKGRAPCVGSARGTSCPADDGLRARAARARLRRDTVEIQPEENARVKKGGLQIPINVKRAVCARAFSGVIACFYSSGIGLQRR